MFSSSGLLMGMTGAASDLITGVFGTIIEAARRGGRRAKHISGAIVEKTKEYYISAILMEINDEELEFPIHGRTQGEVNNKKINTNAILIKINHMKLFLERIFISAGNKIGVRKHKKNLKDYRRKL
jgi:hypothetical protein